MGPAAGGARVRRRRRGGAPHRRRPAEVASEVKALPLLWKALMARLGRLFRRR